jgi:hypothetical protein
MVVVGRQPKANLQVQGRKDLLLTGMLPTKILLSLPSELFIQQHDTISVHEARQDCIDTVDDSQNIV